jgi:hypothetical protein
MISSHSHYVGHNPSPDNGEYLVTLRQWSDHSYTEKNPLVWAKKHCSSFIKDTGYFTVSDSHPYYVFHFGNDQDATMFALKWA